MCHAVIIQVGAGGEPFAAHLTLVWLLPAVDAPVCVQRTGRGKSLAAHQAHVWLLTCHVNSYTVVECTELTKMCASHSDVTEYIRLLRYYAVLTGR